MGRPSRVTLRILPCGTPSSCEKGREKEVLALAMKVLSVRKDWINRGKNAPIQWKTWRISCIEEASHRMLFHIGFQLY